jgi:hypothetical protein
MDDANYGQGLFLWARLVPALWLALLRSPSRCGDGSGPSNFTERIINLVPGLLLSPGGERRWARMLNDRQFKIELLAI